MVGKINREEVLMKLKNQINKGNHIVGTVVGSGMTAKYTALGGADLFLALSAGIYRLSGRSSLCSYLPYGNSNELVMNFGAKELLPILIDKPVIFGLNASDPTIHLYEYIKGIKRDGFSGIVNFPTMSLLDGSFRENLEAQNNSYKNEVEAIRFAHYCDLFTIAFATNIEEAKAMVEAGCDCLCVHLGFTRGGSLGVNQAISLTRAKIKAEEIFNYIDSIRPEIIKVVYGGPISTPIDMKYIYKNSTCNGYFGGSTFDRIPVENIILKTTQEFKNSHLELDKNDLIVKLIENDYQKKDYVDFVKSYIKNNYKERILLSDIALLIHVSYPYLSSLFSKTLNISFTQYLLKYRLDKSKELLIRNQPIKEVAMSVGFNDPMQFSKMFKKHVGISPSKYKEQNI